MNEGREWRVCTDGEKLFTVIGQEAEKMVRAAAAANGGTVSYRDPQPPTRENGYSLQGPWIEAPQREKNGTTMTDSWDDQPITALGELALFLGGSADSFTGVLLTLIAKADPENMAHLELAFPHQVAAWRTWNALRSPTFSTLREALEPGPEDLPSWRPVAIATRQALGVLGHGIPNCLPGEPEACGGNFAEHAMAQLATLRAVVDHRITHLGPGSQPCVEEIYAHELAKLQASDPCDEHPAEPRYTCEHQASNFTPCRECHR